MRIAAVVTPNTSELEALSAIRIRSEPDRERAVEEVMDRTECRALLAKGGHAVSGSAADQVLDVLYDSDGNEHTWRGPRMDTNHTHGTGCTLATAIAVGLAQGLPLDRAVARARTFVRIAMREAPGLGGGHGPMGHQQVLLDIPPPGAPMLNHVTLPASDYAASLGFYAALGCRQIVASPPRYARFEVPGGMTLSIEVRDPVDPPSATEYLFQCDSVDAAVTRLITNGIVFDTMPEDRSYGWRVAEARDPHGNRICLYETPENRRFPPWRIVAEG